MNASLTPVPAATPAGGAVRALGETLVMLRRDTLHARRNPMVSLSAIGTPTFMLLLFGGLFGASMGRTLPAGSGGYVQYLTPGIVLMALGSSVSGTAISACLDKSEGIVDRFRTMPISRDCFLAGQVIGNTVRTTLGVLVVVLVAVAMGFRPASALGLLPALGLVVLAAFAMAWLGVAIGLHARSVAGANSLGLLATLLPFLSPAFVPVDGMPAGVRWIAANQPYAPLIDALRASLTGTGVGTGRVLLAVAWVAVIGVAGYLWARRSYRSEPVVRAGTAAALLNH